MKTVFESAGSHPCRNINTDIDCFIETHQNVQFRYSEVSLSQLDDARLWTDNRTICVLDSDNEVVEELSILPSDFDLAWVTKTPVDELSSPLCLFRHLDPHNYYHWLIDSVANFGVLDRAGINATDLGSIYIHRLAGKFQQDTLLKTRFSDTRLISYKDRPVHLAVKSLFVPQFNPWPNPWFSSYLSDFFAADAKAAALAARICETSLIYISRGEGVRRGVVNETELRQQLESIGFTTVVLQKYSITEQAAILGSADCIVAAHGAGLANICFARSNTQIVEFCGGYISSHFRVLSELCNLRYLAIPAGIDSHGNPLSATPRAVGRNDSYRVNVQKVVNKIQAAIATRDTVH